MHRLLTVLSLMPAVCLASQSHAQPSLQIKPLISYYDHRETAPTGKELNRETGFLEGLDLSAGYDFSNQWHWRLSGQWLTGSVDYDGETQAGSDLNTRTHYDNRHLGLELGFKAEELATRFTGTLYRYTHQRNIRARAGSLPLRERYSGWEGLLIAEQPLPGERFWLSAGLLYRFESQLTSDLTHVGYGQPQLDLPSSWGGHAGLRWRVPTPGNWRGDLGLTYQYRKTPRSDSVRTQRNNGRVLLVTQPKTRVQQWLLGFSLSWHPG